MASNYLETLAHWLTESASAVAFTGAGISTESGIPDFRSPGGIWSQAQPVYFSDFLSSADARQEYWRQKSIAHRDFAGAQPNLGHECLARWENAGLLKGVITQNIDGLHQIAGSENVLELHGTAREIACLTCAARFPPQPLIDSYEQTKCVPECPHCGGFLKHATVSFGQSLPEDVLTGAFQWARDADLFVAMGSSLVVEPAARLPLLAKRSGAKLVIINRDPTPQDDNADLVFRTAIGATLGAVDEIMKQTRPDRKVEPI